MTDLTPTLTKLGDALERAAAEDVRRRRLPWRVPRKVAIAVAAIAVIVPSAAIATRALVTTDQVAASLPQGTLSLAGTEPTCTVVDQDVEYHCVLAHAPAPEVSNWLGTVEPTVDASKHVNGGCRSLASDGKTWECYLGQAAIDQKIIGAGFLGQYAPGPGVG